MTAKTDLRDHATAHHRRHTASTLDVGFRAYKVVYDDQRLSAYYSTARNRRPSLPDVIEPETLLEWIMDAYKGFNSQGDDLTILTNLLLHLGDELVVPINFHVVGKTCWYSVDAGRRIVCLQHKLSLDQVVSLIAGEPDDLVVWEHALGGDEMVVAAMMTVQHASPNTRLVVM